jgi:hypothetical protein
MFKGFNPKACVDKIGLGYAACFREKSSVLKKDSRCFFRPPKMKKHEVLYCLDNVSKCIRSQSMLSTDGVTSPIHLVSIARVGVLF